LTNKSFIALFLVAVITSPLLLTADVLPCKAQTESYTVSGYTFDSTGIALSGVFVYNINSSGISYGSGCSSDSTGFYSMTVPAGTYTLVAKGSPTSGLSCSVNNILVNQNIVEDLTLTTGFIVSGYILDSNGNGVAGIETNIYNSTWHVPVYHTTSSGYYSVFIPAGTYTFIVWPPYDSNFINHFDSQFTVNSDTTKNVTLASGYKVSGFITDVYGNPVSGATTYMEKYGSGYYSKSSGYYYIAVPAGTYTLTAKPGTGQSFPTYTENNVTVNGDMSKNITVGLSATTTGFNPTPTPNSTSTSSDNWSMYRHDQNNTGTSNSSICKGNLEWVFQTSDKIYATAAVVDGVVYDGSWNGYLYALNASTGAKIWEYYSGSNIESSAAVVDGVVYVGILWDGHNGYIVALDSISGSLIWRYSTNSGIESSPTVVNGVVYIGSYSGYVYALNATNGQIIWNRRLGSNIFSSPAVTNDRVYIGSGDNSIYALDAKSGATVWSYQTGGYVHSSPTIVGGVVYVGSHDGNAYALNATDGGKLWSYYTGGYVDTCPAVSNGLVYISSGNGFLVALNATSGELIWKCTAGFGKHNATAFVYSSPVVASGIIYIGTYDGSVIAVNASIGVNLWAYKTGGTFVFSSPAIVDGVIYIGSYDGSIYALGVTDHQIPISSTPPASATNQSATPAATSTTSQLSEQTKPQNNGLDNVTFYANDTNGNTDSQTITSTMDKPQAGVFDNTYSIWVIAVVVAATCILGGSLLYGCFKSSANSFTRKKT
jgi:outer membrane protein assembly factor BamB